jgi:hypothetical protein
MLLEAVVGACPRVGATPAIARATNVTTQQKRKEE